MRGTTVKKINKFIDILMENTPKDQPTKSKKQMFKDVKAMWYKNPQARKFVNQVVKGEIDAACESIKQ